MLNILLTVMLFIMPFLILKKDIPRKGLHTGLWVSLFFLGKLHTIFSIVSFAAALCYYTFNARLYPADTASIYVRKPTITQFTAFLSALVIFCAWGKVYMDYGQAMHLETSILEMAALLELAGSITGPLFFGFLADRVGPFPTTMLLLFLSAASIILVACTTFSIYFLPFGALLMWACISGAFVLMPILVLQLLGRSQLTYTAPVLILSLSVLWGTFFQLYQSDQQKIQNASDNLTILFFLILLAGLFAVISWKKRLVLVK